MKVQLLVSEWCVPCRAAEEVWQRVAQSVTVHNLATVGDVAAQQGELTGAVGEGLAGSLDVVGF